MATFNVEINSRASRDGTFSIFVRVTENRKSRKIKMDFRIPENDFNRNAKFGKWIRMSNSKHAVYNKSIEERIDETRIKYADLAKKSTNPLRSIKKEKSTVLNVTIKTYFAKYLSNLEAESAISYYNHVKSKIDHFKEHFDEDTLLESITTDDIANYKKHLLSAGISNTTVNDYMRRVKAVFTVADKSDVIAKNPFRTNSRLQQTDPDLVRLSDIEIKRLEKAEFEPDKSKWMHNSRNYYLFAYYNAGVRVSDLIQLRYSNFTDDGRMEYEMGKTGFKKSINLSPNSLEIIKQYWQADAEAHHYIFPILSNNAVYVKFATYTEKRKMKREWQILLHDQVSSKTTQINKNLKYISEALELKNPITFHTARHSYADKARRAMKKGKRITIYDIQKSLGHKRISTTEGYWERFDKESLDEAMGDIFDEQKPEADKSQPE